MAGKKNTKRKKNSRRSAAESRLKQFVISEELFLELLKAGAHPGYEVTDGAIPADARIVNVRHGWPNQIEILLTSQEFPELKSGDAIPLSHTCVCRRSQ